MKRVFTEEQLEVRRATSARWRKIKRETEGEEFMKRESLRTGAYKLTKKERTTEGLIKYNEYMAKAQQRHRDKVKRHQIALKDAGEASPVASSSGGAVLRRSSRHKPLGTTPCTDSTSLSPPSHMDTIDTSSDTLPCSATSPVPASPSLPPSSHRTKTPSSQQIVVRLPFYNKMRNLKRQLVNREAHIEQSAEEIRKLGKQSVEPSTIGLLPQELTFSTPKKVAFSLMRKSGVSPRKRPKLARQITISEGIVANLKQLPRSDKTKIFQKTARMKLHSISIVAKKLGIRRHSIAKKSRVLSTMRLAAARTKTNLVKDFLLRCDNSVALPCKKDSLKGGTIQRYSLSDTLANLYIKFKGENPALKMSRASFAKCKTPFMKPIQWAMRRQCLCSKHQNVALKLKSLMFGTTSPNEYIKKSAQEIKNQLETLAEPEISFREWRRVDVMYNGSVIKKVRLRDLTLPREEFITTFVNELKEFREHARRVSVQFEQTSIMRQNLSPTEVSVQMDYSENYSCTYQNEVSAVYYDKCQITLHPMVVHYSVEGNIKHKSFVGVSNEKSHNVPTTYSFLEVLIPKIMQLVPDLTLVNFITDSPASQYRNRTIAHIVANFIAIFRISCTWQYLETGHGKGPCDGIGGSVKRMADIATKRGTIINSAESFMEWAKDSDSKVTYLFVPGTTIGQNKRKILRWDVKAVNGIGTVHSLMPHNGRLHMHETSCFKQSCCFQEGIFMPTCTGWIDTGIDVAASTTEFMESTDLETADTEPAATMPIASPELDPHVTEASTPFTIAVSNPQVVESADLHTAEIETEAAMPIVSSGQDSHVTEVNTPFTDVGDYITCIYRKGWYVGKVINKSADELIATVSCMKKARGKFKWGQTDELDVTIEDFLCKVSPPEPCTGSTIMFELQLKDREQVKQLFAARS